MTSQHDFLMRTDKNYRDTVVAETVLMLRDLVMVLAHRNGLEFDPVTGKIEGLSEEEEELLNSSTPAADADMAAVKEASPKHVVPKPESETVEETFLEPGSETDEEGEPQTLSAFLSHTETEDEAEEEKPLTGEALHDRAAELEIEGRSSMNADELREAIAAAEEDQPVTEDETPVEETPTEVPAEEEETGSVEAPAEETPAEETPAEDDGSSEDET